MCPRCVFQSLLGVSYSLLACALWPMVAFVVPEHQLGTAYGLYVPPARMFHTQPQLKHTHSYESMLIIDDANLLLLSISMQSIQNLGLALIAMAAGAILDVRGYLFLEVFFSTCICCQYIMSVYSPTHVRHFWAAVFDSSHCFSSLQLHWWRWWRCTLWIISKVREGCSLSFSHVTSQHTALLTTTRFSRFPLPPGGDLNRSASARAKLQKEATSDAEWVALTLVHPPSLLFRPLTQQLDKHLRNIMTNPTRIIKWNRQMG